MTETQDIELLDAELLPPTAEFGAINPNSEHQRWSRWLFGIQADPGKLPPLDLLKPNIRRYFARGFRSTMGRARCDQQGAYYVITVEIEGPNAQDPEYVESVRRDFVQKFLGPGFGPGARLTLFEVGILAGDAENGEPPSQMLVLPRLAVPRLLTP